MVIRTGAPRQEGAEEPASSTGGSSKATVTDFVPGRALLHPAPLLAALLIAANMLWFKGRYAGWWTGKLSDLAICFFLPVVLTAFFEWGAFALGSRRPAGRRVHLAACAVTVSYFTALQLVPVAPELHTTLLGLITFGGRFAVVPDPTDLIALPMVVPAFLHLSRQDRRSRDRAG